MVRNGQLAHKLHSTEMIKEMNNTTTGIFLEIIHALKQFIHF